MDKRRWCHIDKKNKQIASFQLCLPSERQLLKLSFHGEMCCDLRSVKLQQHYVPFAERKKRFLCHYRYATSSYDIIGEK